MKEPIEMLILEKFTIQVYDENDYSFTSTNNEIRYGHVYVDIDRQQPTTLFGIEVLVDESVIAPASLALPAEPRPWMPMQHSSATAIMLFAARIRCLLFLCPSYSCFGKPKRIWPPASKFSP